jgi:uncharacterized protein (DUF736 family)
MNKTIRRVTDRDEQDAETYRYWQSLPAGERLAAGWETTRDQYAGFLGVTIDEVEQGSPRTLVRFKREQR